ncbi:GNAT family N-acetyltransferase [Sediminibacillus albus]|uniref:L-amino acid N-acyltransferase YncA n=1 Tax=Sediminibacillus albus TaxID=407036 RepID=A0A1G9BP25_9BACI|nr:GNAT family N-acetyltransferase [Sediminibacillus albus]SDK41206.1 L-amino acid N-acyltransferase YncA [Sediminibacillus albus]
MITIRQAVQQDVKAIAKVSVDSWLTTYQGILPENVLNKVSYQQRKIAWQKRLSDSSHYLFVAETHEGVVGFINGGKERTNNYPFTGEIYSFYILKEYQRRKIGVQLMDTLVQRFLDDGTDSMLVWVLEDNPSRKFYESFCASCVDKQLLEELDVHEIALGWSYLQKLSTNLNKIING